MVILHFLRHRLCLLPWASPTFCHQGWAQSRKGRCRSLVRYVGLAWTWLDNRFVHGRKVNTVLCVRLLWKAFVLRLRS